MAEAAVTENLEQRVSELCICAICTEKLQNCKLLFCHHSFCLQCLKKLADARGGRKIQCPICRQPFTIPSAGLDSLQSNFYVQTLLEINGEQKGMPDSMREYCCYHYCNSLTHFVNHVLIWLFLTHHISLIISLHQCHHRHSCHPSPRHSQNFFF